MSDYTDTHETDIQGVISRPTDKAYCVDCAVTHLFGSDQAAFALVDNGADTSLRDAAGDPFDLIHEVSVSYAASDAQFYPQGLFCSECGATIVEPRESW